MTRMFQIIKDIFPTFKWLNYASYRLGVGILIYFCTNAIIALASLIAGVTLGFFALFAMIPVSILIAIKASGAIAKKYEE
tara:strand:+ start:279 stop:518 length:240 start_codon:yes stop_codon:yes gene_type:complete